jgi:hypothetical protein
VPRFLRIQYENAIYHIVTGGDGRRKLFHCEDHYNRFTKGLAEEVDRSGWKVVAFLAAISSLSVFTVDDVIESTAKEHGVSSAEYSGFRSCAGARDVAAYHCRHFTSATLAELSERFGLGHPDSSSDVVKRAMKLIESNREVRKRAERIKKCLLSKPETRVRSRVKRFLEINRETLASSRPCHAYRRRCHE